jgi:hypothetical protein
LTKVALLIVGYVRIMRITLLWGLSKYLMNATFPTVSDGVVPDVNGDFKFSYIL